MRSVSRWLTVLISLFILSARLSSQADSSIIFPDTISTIENDKDTNRISSQQLIFAEFKPTKSPMLTLGLSAILPGAGQFYTENYWKVPIIWGVGGYWVYEWVSLNNKYKDFREKYIKNPNEQYLRLRDFYRDERDKFAWFLGALYILNLVDAFAGAHLYDFDVSPELALDGRIVPRVAASLRFPF